MKTFRTDIDNIIILGENDKENSDIIKTAKQNQYWFHLKSNPSPHAILETDEPTQNEINYVANIVKSKSKLKNLKNVKIIYTLIKNIRLTNKLGCVQIKKKCKIVTV
jgi:predicted ribosome quality control (RQC) complex YloA/Tae2 family protein